MIEIYTGTPGSGKSLHLAQDMMMILGVKKKSVIANFPINMDMVSKNGRRKTGEFIYLPNDKLTVDYLINYAKENHKPGIEGQSYICIDEAAMLFNTRTYGSFDRPSWINFFMTHRHYGYNVIMVAQNDRLIDRQIREFIENNVIHRKANNYKTIGIILTILGIQTFAAIKVWYGTRERMSGHMFRYKKKYSKLYETMMLFGDEEHGTKIGEGKGEGQEINPSLAINRDISKENNVTCHSAKYYSEAKTTLESFKFRGRKELAKIMAEDLTAVIKKSIPDQIDYVTWIPASEDSKKTRGFDQSELLAYWTAKDINKPAVELLINSRQNQEQKTLGKRERMQNKAGAYKMTVDTLQGKTIMIIDDIVTTGASLYEAAKTLSIGGAKKIICLTYADANEKNKPPQLQSIWEQNSTQQAQAKATGKKKKAATPRPPPVAAAAPGDGDAGARGSPAPQQPPGVHMDDDALDIDAIDELYAKMKAM